MELRHLRYFSIVAEELNFRRAASRLHISRPALSKQIKNLEQELGVQLIERNTVQVSLTTAGVQFRLDALHLLDQVDEATARARQNGTADSRLLIGDPGPFASSFMPAGIKRFRRMHPRVEVCFVPMHPGEAIAALGSGKVQIALVLGREMPPPRKFQSALVLRSPLGVALSPHHPLARAREISPEQLGGEKILCMSNSPRSPHRSDILEIYAGIGLRPPAIIPVAGFEALVTMIASEQGISFLPTLISSARTADMKIVPLNPDCTTGTPFELWGVWRAADRTSFVRDFVQAIQRPGKPLPTKTAPK